MKASLMILVLSAAVAATSQAFAFETVTVDPFPSSTLSTKLSDPEDIVQDMSNRYTGNSATIFHSGNTTIGIVGSAGGYSGGPNSPFLPDPSIGMVPSKRQW